MNTKAMAVAYSNRHPLLLSGGLGKVMNRVQGFMFSREYGNLVSFSYSILTTRKLK